MKKRILCFFIFVMTLMTLSSCSRLSSSIETAEIVLTMDATAPPTIVPTATMDMYIEKYIDWLNQHPSAYDLPIVSLSPNGLIMTSRPDPFEVGKDTVKIVNEQTGVNRDIPLDYDTLDLPVDSVPTGIMSLYGGSLSADYTNWSPDSKAFLIEGGAIFRKEYAFLIIFDISNQDNIQTSIVKWIYEGDPYTAWSPDSTSLLIWFGPEIPLGKMFTVTYTEKAWIVDRKGKLINEFDVSGYRSPFWAGSYLYAIKGENEIWRIDPTTGNSEYLSPIRIIQSK